MTHPMPSDPEVWLNYLARNREAGNVGHADAHGCVDYMAGNQLRHACKIREHDAPGPADLCEHPDTTGLF